jgi:hypothetical protein
MKLSPIPGHEPTSKVQFSWKTSTVEQLQQYIAFYKTQTGVEVSMKDVTEQMLLDFMKEDKDFAKFLKASSTPEQKVDVKAGSKTQVETKSAATSASSTGHSFGHAPEDTDPA